MQRTKPLVGFLAATAVLAAIMPTLAQAIPMPSAANASYYDSPYSSGPGEMPYVSPGVGPSTGADVGVSADDRSVSRATPIQPTLARLSGAVGPDDRALSRATPVEPTPIVTAQDDGFSVDFGNSYLVAIALMLGLLAGGSAVAIWHTRRTKLSPA